MSGRHLPFSPNHTLQLTVAVQLDCSATGALTDSFSVTLLPGRAVGLQLVSSLSDTYTEGEMLPPLQFVCVDQYGHHTTIDSSDGPQKLILSNLDLDLPNSPFEVRIGPDGKAVFDAVKLSMTQDKYIPLSGLLLQYSVRSDEGPLSLEFSHKIQRARKPNVVKVSHVLSCYSSYSLYVAK